MTLSFRNSYQPIYDIFIYFYFPTREHSLFAPASHKRQKSVIRKVLFLDQFLIEMSYNQNTIGGGSNRDFARRGGSGQGRGRQGGGRGQTPRCGTCNYPFAHACSCSEESLARLTEVHTLEEMVVEGPNGVELFLQMYWNPPTRKYVFRTNTTKRWNAGVQLTPQDSNSYFRVSMEELEALAEENPEAISPLALRQERARETRVFGNSSNCKSNGVWTKTVLPAQVESISRSLRTEELLALKIRQSPTRVEAKVSLSKGVVDHHNLDTAIGLLIGPCEVLEEISASYAAAAVAVLEHRMSSDEPNALLVVPLSWLALSSEALLPLLCEKWRAAAGDVGEAAIENVPNPVAHFHLKEVRMAVLKWIEGKRSGKISPADCRAFPLDRLFADGTTAGGLYALVTVTVWKDVDMDNPDGDRLLKTNFSLGGGKKELCETPWETFSRECREECGVDLSRNRVHFRDEPVPGSELREGVQWEVRLHIQEKVNMFYVIHSSAVPVVDQIVAEAEAEANDATTPEQRDHLWDSRDRAAPREGGAGGGGVENTVWVRGAGVGGGAAQDSSSGTGRGSGTGSGRGSGRDSGRGEGGGRRAHGTQHGTGTGERGRGAGAGAGGGRRVCLFFREGCCRNGADCTFLHET